MPSVLLFGASGYIGGHFLVKLRKSHPEIPVTAIVRSTTHTQGIEATGAKVVQGTFADTDLITDLSSKSDVIINAADCDDQGLTNAILKGIQIGGKKSAIIHVSGAGNFLDGGKSGAVVANAKTWSDADEADIKTINAGMIHGACDEIILKEGLKGYASTYIVSPVGVHGPSDGPAGGFGVLPRWLVNNALSVGYAPFVGDGSAVFQTLYLDDVVNLILAVFDKALEGPVPDGSSPYSRYYIAGGITNNWKTISAALAKELHANGKIPDAEAKSVEYDKAGFLSMIIGANMVTDSKNARSLGWVPKGPSILETMPDDVKRVLASMDAEKTAGDAAASTTTSTATATAMDGKKETPKKKPSMFKRVSGVFKKVF